MNQLLSVWPKRSIKLLVICPADRLPIQKYLSTNRLILKQLDRNVCKVCANNYRKRDNHLKRDLRTKYSTISLINNIFIRNEPIIQLNSGLCSATTVRWFHPNPSLWDSKDSSKVEQTVKALREEHEEKEKKVATGEPTEVVVAPKRSLGKRIWDELVHYYHGFRLLIIDVRVSSKLVWKVLNGDELSRREHRQLVRTTSDIFRLVPFSVFIIVPFMELLLPFFIKFFPGMLPSTFETATVTESKAKKELKLKLEMAKFLQDTLDEMSLKAKGETHSAKAKEFADFFNKIRTTGEQASNKDIMNFSKLFEDELTLDSLSRSQLSALCRLIEITPIGTNNFLRFQLRLKLRSLLADDQMIKKEGVDSLTVPELIQACRARGMRAIGLPEARLRSQLSQWLELSLDEKIPPSLLLLSRLLYLPEHLPAVDQLKATIQQLPETVGTEAKYKIGETEGKVDNKTKIELIRQEEEAIKREIEEEKREQIEKLQEKEVLIDKATDLEAKLKDKLVDKAKELSQEDVDSIERALEDVSNEKKKLLVEKEELQDLKKEMKDYTEDIKELEEISAKTGLKNLTETKAAQRLRNKVNKMVNKMDKIMFTLESKKDSLQKKIDSLSKEGKEIDEKEREDVVSINELIGAISRLQKVGDETKLESIMEVLDNMDVDHDGRVEVEHVVKVLELLGREKVNVSSTQVKDLMNLLIQEEKIEEERKLKLKETLEKELQQTTGTKADGSGSKTIETKAKTEENKAK